MKALIKQFWKKFFTTKTCYNCKHLRFRMVFYCMPSDASKRIYNNYGKACKLWEYKNESSD